MTESMKAFEAAYSDYDHRLGVDGKYHSRASEDAYTYFTKGVAYGRKQALEDALKIAEDQHLDLDGSEYHRGWRNASIRLVNLFKRLIK